jgi:hypothetical protein
MSFLLPPLLSLPLFLLLCPLLSSSLLLRRFTISLH